VLNLRAAQDALLYEDWFAALNRLTTLLQQIQVKQVHTSANPFQQIVNAITSVQSAASQLTDTSMPALEQMVEAFGSLWVRNASLVMQELLSRASVINQTIAALPAEASEKILFMQAALVTINAMVNASVPGAPSLETLPHQLDKLRQQAAFPDIASLKASTMQAAAELAGSRGSVQNVLDYLEVLGLMLEWLQGTTTQVGDMLTAYEEGGSFRGLNGTLAAAQETLNPVTNTTRVGPNGANKAFITAARSMKDILMALPLEQQVADIGRIKTVIERVAAELKTYFGDLQGIKQAYNSLGYPPSKVSGVPVQHQMML
jgi:hypothetical protein